MVALVGCGVGVGTAVPTPLAVPGMHGQIYGGQQPIAGSNIQLYATGTTGYGSSSIPLLNKTVTSDANGNFNITGDYTCPSSSTPVYMYITGGNPGLTAGTNNTSIALMGLLGFCGDLTPSTYLVINEMTTVAAVYALAPFMLDATHIGTSSTNVQGLLNAVETSGSLVSIANGLAPGEAPAVATIPVNEIHTLADILTSCVNSSGSTSPSSSCGRLFTAATPAGGTAPTDTIAATLDIARNPGHNTSSIFNTVPSNGPFQPILTSTPADWTIGIQYASPSFQNPSDLAIDSQGNAWVLSGAGANSTVSVLNWSGITASYLQTGNNYAHIALDVYDDPWLTDTVHSTVMELTNSGTRATLNPFSGGGLQGPGALAFDGAGNVWIANNGPTLSKLNANGVAISPPGGYSTGGSSAPLSIAIDTSGSAWITDLGNNSIEVLGSSGQPIPGAYTSGGLNGPFAIAIDTTGGAWIANRGGSSLSRLSSSGEAIAGSAFSGGGLNAPIGIALDGLDNVWLVNSGSNSVSEFLSSGRPQSALGGYGSASLTNPYRAAVDTSGNVWVANLGAVKAGTGMITQIVGVAAPVVTPQALAVRNNALDQRP